MDRFRVGAMDILEAIGVSLTKSLKEKAFLSTNGLEETIRNPRTQFQFPFALHKNITIQE